MLCSVNTLSTSRLGSSGFGSPHGGELMCLEMLMIDMNVSFCCSRQISPILGSQEFQTRLFADETTLSKTHMIRCMMVHRTISATPYVTAYFSDSQRQATKDAVSGNKSLFFFGGSNFVPDIPSLQRWLDLAWKNGFDVSGAHFDNKVYGCKKWIGTSECAALLRSFGLRARVVDFAPKDSRSVYLSVPGSVVAPKRRAYGPMGRYVIKNGESGKEKSGSSSSRISKGAVLMDWVWNYFSDNRPLYFQHEGHSRTIIGIQRQLQGNTFTPQYNLLVLDPADILYVDNGIAVGEELEQLKTIDGHFVEF
ncbi:unnamed protein product [Eruca vesicaria subsp. sativa]|uniref:UFSP1/2/DUB catalytic domain-containing protein n=1 Tax=Eruca vesicaria subsp. sativa TaxID=29727 RepID=A0ABC8K3T8_ERUVS|nr:unnamed protein product [Eruca vesicaria subsp. sativa]